MKWELLKSSGPTDVVSVKTSRSRRHGSRVWSRSRLRRSHAHLWWPQAAALLA